MSDPIYEPGVYKRFNSQTVLRLLWDEGWTPVPITDKPGAVYPLHRHAETKLLAFLAGSMEVHTGGKTYHCQAGDKLVIPGHAKHSAVVGPQGCTFYWSEQLRERP